MIVIVLTYRPTFLFVQLIYVFLILALSCFFLSSLMIYYGSPVVANKKLHFLIALVILIDTVVIFWPGSIYQSISGSVGDIQTSFVFKLIFYGSAFCIYLLTLLVFISVYLKVV